MVKLSYNSRKGIILGLDAYNEGCGDFKIRSLLLDLYCIHVSVPLMKLGLLG